MFNIFKKKPKKLGLERAKELNLISEEEFLILKIERFKGRISDLNKGKKKKK